MSDEGWAAFDEQAVSKAYAIAGAWMCREIHLFLKIAECHMQKACMRSVADCGMSPARGIVVDIPSTT